MEDGLRWVPIVNILEYSKQMKKHFWSELSYFCGYHYTLPDGREGWGEGNRTLDGL